MSNHEQSGEFIAASEVIEAINAFKSLWLKVPAFGNKVNRATREAVTMAHGPLFLLLYKAEQAKAGMPARCTTGADCKSHGCHGDCLPDDANTTPQAENQN